MAGHQNRDPVSGYCVDCGCRQAEIEDGAACDPVPRGPNRFAIIALKRELRELDSFVRSAERLLRSYEDAIPGMTQQLLDKRALRATLAASIEKLASEVPPGFDFGALAKLRQDGSGY